MASGSMWHKGNKTLLRTLQAGLVLIYLVLLEKIEMWKVHGRRTPSDGNSLY